MHTPRNLNHNGQAPLFIAWGPLQAFNCYRILLASTLLLLRFLDTSFVGRYDPSLFTTTCYLYAGIGLIFLIATSLKKPNFESQVILQVFTDICFLTILMHSSGGITTGLSMLLLVVIAFASLFTPGRLSFLYTAMASLAILTQQVVVHITQPQSYKSFSDAGINGAMLFATAIATNLLSRRLHKLESFGKQQTAALAKLEQLNALIIRQMQTAVMVVNDKLQILMLNQAAFQLFNKEGHFLYRSLDSFSPELNKITLAWLDNPSSDAIHIPFADKKIHLNAKLIKLGQALTSGILIFVEDETPQMRKVQQIKLASLGRLTASIAHEIRNPLGAISHANQLLFESKNISSDDQRLLNIIKDNTKRTNKIIENILQLSRETPPSPKAIRLNTWLSNFIEQFVVPDCPQPDITYSIMPENLMVQIDPSQLQQIITNLCENGIRYSMKHSGQPTLIIDVSVSNQQAVIDIYDKGPGIANEDEKYLFEPFFTTENTGTGLGLFIAREMCHANDAHLEYREQAQGSCFRLTVPTMSEESNE